VSQPPPVWLPFSDKKIIPQNTKQDGTDRSSVGIPPVSRKRKTLEFRSKPFLGREKPLDLCSKPFSNDTTLEFFSKPFSEEKTSEFRSEQNSKGKKLRIPYRTIFKRENT
jgi:hypothetical protein